MPELPAKEPDIPSLQKWIKQLQNTWLVVQKALYKAREAYKAQSDKRRVEQKLFKVGHKVYFSTKYLQ
ncbi:hypothetical protein NXF25_012667 [Crotalus adamanteus]|uniref:Uncharacterized protein n=1 Tax=Crotalus adamanteus TaxID=8729 RepID=A0AAW1BDC5_CROAD